MLIRLITAIALLVFALLMMSGAEIELALYRTLMVFLVLFAGVYLTIFFINIIQAQPESSAAATSSGSNKDKSSESDNREGKTSNKS